MRTPIEKLVERDLLRRQYVECCLLCCVKEGRREYYYNPIWFECYSARSNYGCGDGDKHGNALNGGQLYVTRQRDEPGEY